MADKQQKRKLLVEKRARALAMMLLTRRGDLMVEEVKDDIGLDYIVRFRTDGKEGLREFGIELRAAWPKLTKEDADRELLPAMRQVKSRGPFLPPVCLFLFTMEDDGAWFTWVAEPAGLVRGRPKLRIHEHPDCRPLDKRALEEIVRRVDAWYDAVFPGLVVSEVKGGS
jgi:hypothetical protein